MFTHSELDAMMFLLIVIIGLFAIAYPLAVDTWKVDTVSKSLDLLKKRTVAEWNFRIDFETNLAENDAEYEMLVEAQKTLLRWIDEDSIQPNAEELLRMYRSEYYSNVQRICELRESKYGISI